MGAIIATGTAVSLVLNSKSADQISGTYQFLPYDAMVYIYARCSATGINILAFLNGQAVVNDLPLPWTGTAGAITRKDHEVASFPAEEGSRMELYLRNTTGGTLTTDYLVEAEPLEE